VSMGSSTTRGGGESGSAGAELVVAAGLGFVPACDGV